MKVTPSAAWSSSVIAGLFASNARATPIASTTVGVDGRGSGCGQGAG